MFGSQQLAFLTLIVVCVLLDLVWPRRGAK